MTVLLAVLRTVAEEAPAPCSVASFERRLLLSCETLPAASMLCTEKVSAQVKRAPRTRPDGLVLTVEEPVVPTPHSQHPLSCAARRTMRAVTWRYRRLMRRLPDLLALLQQCAADTRVSRTMGSRNERLCHSWALAPDASRATRAAVDAVLSRASLSVTRLSGAMDGDPPPAVPRADGVPATPLPRRNVLDRAFIRGEAQARLDEPTSAGGY